MNHKYTPILALDPASETGWALWIPGASKPLYGSWKLVLKGKNNNHGARRRRLLDSIQELLKDNKLSNNLALVVVVEAPAPGAQRNSGSISLSEGWIPVVQLWCHDRGLAEPELAPIATWRNHFLPSKKPKALKGTEATDWYKREAIEACKERGLEPADSNAAEAIGILKWAIDGGVAQRRKTLEQKKQQTRNRRAQMKMKLEFDEANRP
jgi:hypothetical protein